MITNPLCLSLYEPLYLHHPPEPENLSFNLGIDLQPIPLKPPRPPLRQSKQGKPEFAIISNISPLTSAHSPNRPHLSPFVLSSTSTSVISIRMGATGSYISMTTLWQECTMIYGCRSMRQARSVGPLCMDYPGIAIVNGCTGMLQRRESIMSGYVGDCRACSYGLDAEVIEEPPY